MIKRVSQILNFNSLLYSNTNVSSSSSAPVIVNAQSLVQAIIDDFMLVENIYIHFNPSECEVFPSKTNVKIDSITVQSLHETQKIKPSVELYTYINKIIKPTHSQIIYSATQESFRSETGEVIKYYPYVVE